uniref:NADH dehydrogenase [ubiquinone] 1 alpha subcomplex subunit 3 n=1 Tax=Rhinolophus ferrumequinum TaxID=59479 RepID=A0A671EJX8_RHIFE
MRGLIGDSRAETTTSGVLATASDRCSEPVRMSRLSGSSRAGTTIPRVLRAPAATAVAETKMAGRLSAFFKNAWAKEPVLVASFTIGGLAIVLPPLSPYTKYAARINQVTPYNYPGEWGQSRTSRACVLGRVMVGRSFLGRDLRFCRAIWIFGGRCNLHAVNFTSCSFFALFLLWFQILFPFWVPISVAFWIFVFLRLKLSRSLSCFLISVGSFSQSPFCINLSLVSQVSTSASLTLTLLSYLSPGVPFPSLNVTDRPALLCGSLEMCWSQWPPPVSQCLSGMMATCPTYPVTPRTPRAQVWSG